MRGKETGATGLEPATSGVTGRRSPVERGKADGLDDRGEMSRLLHRGLLPRLKLQAFCKQRPSAVMQLGSASMQWSVPEMAWNPRFGGTLRHACTESGRLITRRSQVQILPPLLEKALETGPFA
jgi:hypothetical protein